VDEHFPVVITSYEILLADIKFMAKHTWKYIVVDEASTRAEGAVTTVASDSVASGVELCRKVLDAGFLRI
jgi:SNF2 family DNA or RNA helicase